MALTVPKQEQQAIEKIQSFTESVMPSFTGDMVQDIAEKAVKGIELADEILQPETLELLRVLPEVSKNLERTLSEFKKLEESGALSTLFDLAQLVSSAKDAMTSHMVFDLAEKAFAGVELADSFVQKGTFDLANQALAAFEQAKKENELKKSITKLQLWKQLNHPETLKSISFFLTFLQKFSKEMKN
ncbi:hypothetical protein ACQYAD_08420 [Neobacillus sp. SM06]|uniref:hypothetical protein n=1 Tax=Neobacillus sp. SM06 TaxID=3422492 RepID=UPI003D2DA834